MSVIYNASHCEEISTDRYKTKKFYCLPINIAASEKEILFYFLLLTRMVTLFIRICLKLTEQRSKTIVNFKK